VLFSDMAEGYQFTGKNLPFSVSPPLALAP
jgi:hypothetical protein